MEEKYGWEREYKGSNPRGNLLLADYRREMAAKRAKAAELERMLEEEQAARSDLENETKKRDELKSEVAILEKKAEESKRIAIMFASKPKDAYFEVREKYLDLMADNERLKEENRGLRHKLEQAYEFMKQFVINGKNMLEAFLEKTGQVIERVLGR